MTVSEISRQSLASADVEHLRRMRGFSLGSSATPLCRSSVRSVAVEHPPPLTHTLSRRRSAPGPARDETHSCSMAVQRQFRINSIGQRLASARDPPCGRNVSECGRGSGQCGVLRTARPIEAS